MVGTVQSGRGDDEVTLGNEGEACGAQMEGCLKSKGGCHGSAQHNGRPVPAVAFTIRTNQTMVSYPIGRVQDFKAPLNPNDLIFWEELICFAYAFMKPFSE